MFFSNSTIIVRINNLDSKNNLKNFSFLNLTVKRIFLENSTPLVFIMKIMMLEKYIIQTLMSMEI